MIPRISSPARPAAPDAIRPVLLSRRDGPDPPPASASLTCLWSRGFIANRRRLTHLIPALSPPDDDALASALFARLGDRAAEQVEGPFSWLTWDPERRELTAVADRLGLAPVCYAECGDRLAVGGSPAAVLALLGLPARPHHDALLAHLHGRGAPPGQCHLATVRVVEPGTAVTFQRHGVRRRRYWRLEAPQPLRLASDPDYAAHLRSLLAELAVDYAPPGRAAVSMSGGLDSTSIAAALRRAVPAADLSLLHRTTPRFPDADDRAMAALAARRLGLEVAWIPVDGRWPLSHPQGIATSPDTPVYAPFADPWRATWERAAELSIGTVYTGAGGDHLFGGSHLFPHADLLLRGRWRRLLRELREHRAVRETGWTRLLWTTLVRPLARAAAERWRFGPVLGRVAVPWVRPQAAQRWREMEEQAWHGRRRTGLHLPAHQLRLRFLDDVPTRELLVSLGRQAAEHGIELRHPMMDRRLFELALSLPAEQTFSGGRDKTVLRRAMAGELPAELLQQRHKVYPFALFRHGLCAGGRDAVQRLTRDMRAAETGLVDEAALRRAFERYCRGDRGGGGLLWNALTLEDWLRRHC